MLSLPKLLALAAVIAIVWFGFRMLDRRTKGAGTGDDAAQGGRAGNNRHGKDKAGGPLDLEECSLCHAWVAGEACDRDACPYKAG